ncbi:MAG: hypothetical protein ACI9R3_000336 [Verrucomicrobiales bacterium]|jgi:hypothetical protein
MNVEEVKERLSCYRPGIDDPADELFAPALSAAEQDPELAKWMKDQQAFDSAVRGHLESMAIPDGLLEYLQTNKGKAALKDNVAEETPKPDAKIYTGRKGNNLFANFWMRAAAVAAAVVIGLLVMNSLNSPASAVEAFRGDMASIANEGFELDHKTGNLLEARKWLAGNAAPIYNECPPCIKKMKGIGCRKFQWNEHTVSIVCFEKETGNVVHMFVIDRSALPDADVASGKVPLKQQKGLETGGWVDEKNVYLLVGSRKNVLVNDLL